MKSAPVLAVVGLALAATAAVWLLGQGPRAPATAKGPTAAQPAAPGEAAQASAEVDAAAAPRAQDTAPSPGPVAPEAATVAAGKSPAAAPADAAPSWPVAPEARAAKSSQTPAAAPAVTVELAFAALARVGIDAGAEKTWVRAIDDPNMPANVRSDLIEDLNQEGFTDNSHPTKADLPLILARLELIERLAPLARDAVNAAAFEEAYKDLLEMYVRLGGAPRDKK